MQEAAFCRVEVYARARAKLAQSRVATAGEVVAEIARREGFCDHVDDLVRPGDKPAPGPRPPVTVWGCDPETVPEIIEREIAALKARGIRAPRRDTPVLAGYVVSAPVSPSRFARDPAAAAWTKRLLRASLHHLRRETARRGGRVVSAVAHLDESRVHMHVLALPSEVPGYTANALHPGRAARRAAQAAGRNAVDASRAASAALSDFVDAYHAQVGRPFGLLRRTAARPRRRLSRAALRRVRAPAAGPRAARPAVAAPPAPSPGRPPDRPWRLADFVAGADTALARLASGPGRTAAPPEPAPPDPDPPGGPGPRGP
jgi:hypothetical protein